jgi:hypothetical protein
MKYEILDNTISFFSTDCFVASLLAMTPKDIPTLLSDSTQLPPLLVIASRRLLAARQSRILDKFER